MLLQALRDLGESIPDLPPLFYGKTPIRYTVLLDREGHLTIPEPLDSAEPKALPRGSYFHAPEMSRSSGVAPLLLADKPDYTFGMPVDDGAKALRRAEDCHRAYLSLLEECAGALEGTEPGALVGAALSFLTRDPLGELRMPDAEEAQGAKFTFRVDGKLLFELPEVMEFWQQRNMPEALGDCLVCSREQVPICRVMPMMIKRVPQGKSSGNALVSVNFPSGESYEQNQVEGSPICPFCADLLSKGLQELIDGKEHHIKIGDESIALFWTSRGFGESSLLEIFDDPQPEDVKRLLRATEHPSGARVVESERYRMMALSGSGARISIRSWLDMALPKAQENMLLWLERQRIADYRSEDGTSVFSVYRLLRTTVRSGPGARSEPLPPRALPDMVTAALLGQAPPWSLAQLALGRARVEEHPVPAARAALLKLMLSHQQEDGQPDLTRLNEDHPSPGYQCGRLFCELEEAQHAALGIRSMSGRFYGSASMTPALVFGRLVRGAQPHLDRLQRDRPGAYFALQERLTEIMGRIDSFPSTMSIQEQALFALGYYHQHQHDMERVKEHQAARAQAQAETTSDQGGDGDG
jgi:CRISPR-associated protein Csd1